MKIKLKKAIISRGEEVRELDLNLEEITGNDIIEAERQVMISDNVPMVTVFNKSYQIAVAGRALKIPVETLRAMNARDFMAISNEVQSFLLNSDSSETDGAEIQETALGMSSDALL